MTQILNPHFVLLRAVGVIPLKQHAVAVLIDHGANQIATRCGDTVTRFETHAGQRKPVEDSSPRGDFA